MNHHKISASCKHLHFAAHPKTNCKHKWQTKKIVAFFCRFQMITNLNTMRFFDAYEMVIFRTSITLSRIQSYGFQTNAHLNGFCSHPNLRLQFYGSSILKTYQFFCALVIKNQSDSVCFEIVAKIIGV